MLKLFVIDDHPCIREGLSRSCDGHFEVVGSGSVKAALASDQIKTSNIIILDLYIKGEDPEINFKMLKNAFPDKPVVIYSSEDRLCWKQKMYKCGVKAYMTKDMDPDSIIKKLKDVAKGIPPDFSELNGSLVLNRANVVEEKVSGITEIMDMIIEGYGTEEIATKTKQSQSKR